MREKGSWSDETYRTRATEAKIRGSSTFAGEKRAQEGRGLDPLVDPEKYGVVRESNNLLVPDGEEFILQFGVAMPVETDLDTTGSMGRNVDVAFGALPKVQNLLIQGPNAVLRRYHTQIATGVIQDRGDTFPYQRSQFEPDNEVERQMGLLVPERDGGDAPEDYQIGLFAAAYLTKASITQYGLRGYHFTVGDERGRDKLDRRVLEQVFGPSVFEKAFGSKPPQSLPSTEEVAKKVLENWHAFFLQVGNSRGTTEWWSKLFGRERVIVLPRTEDLAEVQACIIGLTEGVLDPDSALEILGANRNNAQSIVRAVADIPAGLQATFPNFNRIPPAGVRFKSREDIWPIGSEAGSAPPTSDKKTKEPSKKSGKGKKEDDWKL
ncbi:MAG: hypothetical protein Q8P01_04645 [bacterium]|nr:hypothetical protein [bacterium]